MNYVYLKSDTAGSYACVVQVHQCSVRYGVIRQLGRETEVILPKRIESIILETKV